MARVPLTAKNIGEARTIALRDSNRILTRSHSNAGFVISAGHVLMVVFEREILSSGLEYEVIEFFDPPTLEEAGGEAVSGEPNIIRTAIDPHHEPYPNQWGWDGSNLYIRENVPSRRWVRVKRISFTPARIRLIAELIEPVEEP